MKNKTLFKWMIIGVFVFACAASCAFAGTNNSFAMANQALSRGEFQTALDLYEEASQGGVSANLYFNMGLAHEKLGQPAKAVVFYERALALDPAMGMAGQALAGLRRELGQPAAPVPWHKAWAEILPVNTWTMIALGGFMGFALTVFLSGLRVRRGNGFPKEAFGALVGFTLLVMGVSLLGGVLQSDKYSRAVVMEDQAAVRLSPFDSAQQTGKLDLARTVQMGKHFGQYVLVHTEKGKTGWVKSSDLEPVVES